MRQFCSESGEVSFRLLARAGTSAGSTSSSPSSGGGTIRKQVRTASVSALFVACHSASRPASCTHSSSSHSFEGAVG